MRLRHCGVLATMERHSYTPFMGRHYFCPYWTASLTNARSERGNASRCQLYVLKPIDRGSHLWVFSRVNLHSQAFVGYKLFLNKLNFHENHASFFFLCSCEWFVNLLDGIQLISEVRYHWLAWFSTGMWNWLTFVYQKSLTLFLGAGRLVYRFYVCVNGVWLVFFFFLFPFSPLSVTSLSFNDVSHHLSPHSAVQQYSEPRILDLSAQQHKISFKGFQ